MIYVNNIVCYHVPVKEESLIDISSFFSRHQVGSGFILILGINSLFGFPAYDLGFVPASYHGAE